MQMLVADKKDKRKKYRAQMPLSVGHINGKNLIYWNYILLQFMLSDKNKDEW